MCNAVDELMHVRVQIREVARIDNRWPRVGMDIGSMVKPTPYLSVSVAPRTRHESIKVPQGVASVPNAITESTIIVLVNYRGPATVCIDRGPRQTRHPKGPTRGAGSISSCHQEGRVPLHCLSTKHPQLFASAAAIARQGIRRRRRAEQGSFVFVIKWLRVTPLFAISGPSPDEASEAEKARGAVTEP